MILPRSCHFTANVPSGQGLLIIQVGRRACRKSKGRNVIKNTTRIAAVILSGIFLLMPGVASAQDSETPRGERYVPAIWVDPDGCEHWVMDDGAEGYMTPHVNRQGIPVCRRGKLCGVMQTDQFFGTDQWRIGTQGQRRLQEFFRTTRASGGYIITGHTDSRASDDYNLRLSDRRANTVAQIAQRSGARVIEVRGYGERQPRASNDTSKGRAENRRVEIICLN